MSALIVLAKSPVAGRVKTRLCPPFDLAAAAGLATAALIDTLEVVSTTPCDRRVLALEGDVGAWLPAGFDVVAQRHGSLADRLAGAFAAVDGSALLLGMDTPQVSPELLTDALTTLTRRDLDAVLGPAVDGGYWAIGLDRPDERAFVGVPMSASSTCTHQLARLAQLGRRVALLPTLRDVDDHLDAAAVATLAPYTSFAAAHRRLSPTMAGVS
jgi:rSAM/selenodomain-associated transferase 1